MKVSVVREDLEVSKEIKDALIFQISTKHNVALTQVNTFLATMKVQHYIIKNVTKYNRI